MKYAFQGFKKKFLEGLSSFGLEDATILDIGCGRGECVAYLTEKTHAAKVFGIDPGLNENPMYSGVCLKGKRFQLLPTPAENSGLPASMIDIAFSLVSFEHLPHLDRTLAEINRILKPGGLFISFWYPIWSSRHGHHFMFWIPELAGLIEPWSHLYLSAEEMEYRLKEYLHPSVVGFVLRYIYKSPYLNRFPYENYMAAFRDMPLEQVYLKEIKTNPPTQDILECIPASMAPACRIGGFDVVFQRPDGTRVLTKETIDIFFEQVHSLEKKISPTSIDDQKINDLIRSAAGKVLVFARQEIQLNDTSMHIQDLERCEIVQGEVISGQLVPDYDLAIILQHSESNYAFTQAISHVIRAKRIVALDETGATMELPVS